MTGPSSSPTDDARALEDRLDALVAEYSDALEAGHAPRHADLLEQVPAGARPGLERCLKMIDSGRGGAPAGTVGPLLPGERFGRYTLKRELGRGGMAVVWLAHDPQLERAVALKLLRPGLAIDPVHVDRFRREALAIAKLKHPGVVQIHEVGTERGLHFLAMEFVEGPSLATVLSALPDERRWTPDELALAAGIHGLASGVSFEQAVSRLLAPVADALQAAHDLGLVHRDVKPSNILLHADGRAVVADFGLAKGEGDPGLSLTGDAIGTPHYMSPEQACLSEAKVDHRSDVYSLGVTLYEALAGRRPFEGRTVLEVFEAIKTQAPPSLRTRNRRATKDATAVAERAMARAPEKRYESAAAFAADLRSLGLGEPTRAGRERPGGLARMAAFGQSLGSGFQYEYRSERTLLGLPLVHIVRGRRAPGQPLRVAKGWLAIGDLALGVVAMGGLSVGLIAFGGLALGGLFTWAGIAVGLGLAVGGMAAAPVAMAGMALGWIALGGMAYGYSALGGMAGGVYTCGGKPSGTYKLGGGHRDEAALEHFQELFPWAMRMMGLE